MTDVFCLFVFTREEQYRQIWAELETYLEAASRTSKMHEKVTTTFLLQNAMDLLNHLLDYRRQFFFMQSSGYKGEKFGDSCKKHVFTLKSRCLTTYLTRT